MTARVARIMAAIAALAAVVAIAAPSALAVPRSTWMTNHPLLVHTATRSQASGAPNGQPMNLPPIDPSSALRFQRVAAYQNVGFDWTAAGIGALAAAGASAVVFGVMFDVRRRRQPSVA